MIVATDIGAEALVDLVTGQCAAQWEKHFRMFYTTELEGDRIKKAGILMGIESLRLELIRAIREVSKERESRNHKEHKGCRVWFEAVLPTTDPGEAAQDVLDYLQDPPTAGVEFFVEDEQGKVHRICLSSGPDEGGEKEKVDDQNPGPEV